MRHPLRLTALAALVGIGMSCTDTLGPIATDIARFDVEGSVLLVTNVGEAKLYSLIADRAILPLLDWAPCTNPQTCEGIAAGDTKHIALKDIIGYESGGDELVAYHWYLVPSASSETGFKTDSVRATNIRLK